MCPFCQKKKKLTDQTCQLCKGKFDICSDCLWAVNDVCSLCGKAKCLDCRARKDGCVRMVAVAREGKWGTEAYNTFAMPRCEVGVMTWNINHFENMPAEKTRAIEVLFERHPWLDVLVLQELNASSTLEMDGEDLVMEKGPKIRSLSLGKRPKTSKAKTFWDEDVGRWITPRQQEYYPIILRASSTKYIRSTALPHKPENGGELSWTKSEVLREKYSSWRPIVVHTVLVQGQPVNIAVVHTTPVGKKLGRKGEYHQVLPMMEYVSKAGGFWVIAGDYYLDPESTTQSDSNVTNRNLSELFHSKVSGLGLSFAIPVSATNQSKLQHGLPVIMDRVKRVIDGEKSVVVNKRADFFIYGPGFSRAQAGVVSPRGGLLAVDPHHHALNWWRQISDHAPVGAVLSSTEKCVRLDEMRDEKWLSSEVLETAQAQLEALYKEAAQRAAVAVERMMKVMCVNYDTPLTRSLLTKSFCCMVVDLTATWGSWFESWANILGQWKEQTAEITQRQALQFADKSLQVTEGKLQEMLKSDEVRAMVIGAMREARYALFTLDLECHDIDVTDEDDDYSDVSYMT